MKVTGVIKEVGEVVTGISKADKPWKKVTFVVETSEEYNNIYPLEVFGEEKVDNFLKFNKVGQSVDVDFNVSANEWKGKYFTTLSAWKIFKAEEVKDLELVPTNEEDDLLF
jgi:hypothetical protein